ncbi:MAG: hypothetical protein VB934_06245, partial [Polyangiaceae bacterium]
MKFSIGRRLAVGSIVLLSALGLSFTQAPGVAHASMKCWESDGYADVGEDGDGWTSIQNCVSCCEEKWDSWWQGYKEKV